MSITVNAVCLCFESGKCLFFFSGSSLGHCTERLA